MYLYPFAHDLQYCGKWNILNKICMVYLPKSFPYGVTGQDLCNYTHN
jgi:hypothetical protein